MAKKREIFKVDEDALKDMMASESISCGKSGADVGENVLPVTEKEKNVPEVKTQGQEKSRKTIRADPGLEEKVTERSPYTESRPISAMTCIAGWRVSFPF
mgnify:CR=1 FL=1